MPRATHRKLLAGALLALLTLSVTLPVAAAPRSTPAASPAAGGSALLAWADGLRGRIVGWAQSVVACSDSHPNMDPNGVAVISGPTPTTTDTSAQTPSGSTDSHPDMDPNG